VIQLGLQQAAGESPSIPGTDRVSLERTAQRLSDCLGARFETLSPLAIGGMATIFQVRHRIHGGLLAAKVLHGHLLAREEMVASFKREAMHLARVADHPNLIAIYDCHFDPELSFHLYPFIEGEDLDRLIARKPFSPAESLHMAAQLSSALCHMESHGIVHGDISPGNIRVDTFGRYRLLDLGLSRDIMQVAPSPAGGTPRYTSPEQIEGALPDHRSDLYSLGLVLAESVMGRHLIEGESMTAIERCHLDGTWLLPEVLRKDAALHQLLRGLLARKPEDRMFSAFELSGALAALGYERPEFRSSAAKPRERRRARLAAMTEL
jgi:serine/threonine protein kinase